MKIRVKDGKHNINLWLPNWLVFGKLTERISVAALKYYVSDDLERIPPEKLSVLFAEMRRIKQKYGSWDLVDVQSVDGTMVKIIL